MNTPGISIFQGAESIKINTSFDRLEEEEEIEDQRRRNEELQKELQGAFDDLIEEDETTMDSTSNHNSHYQNQQFPNTRAGTAALDDQERLKLELQSKNNEIENITKILNTERKNFDDLKKRYALSEAEKERSNMNKHQTHELLVESKAKCSELEDTISKLKGKIKAQEVTNNEMIGKLERTQTLLADTEHKYHMVERNIVSTNDRNADNWRKQIEDRHRGQIEMMQNQMDQMRDKINEKDMELKNLDTRYKELQRSRESLLIEKAETINHLARNLEESQKQCQMLMGKQDYSLENIRLQKVIVDYEKQMEDMQKSINTLKSKLDQTTAELDIMDNVLHENTEDSFRRMSQSKGNFIGSTPAPSNSADRVANLKDELYRCMAGQKEKRDQIKKLKEELQTKISEIKTLKNEENQALVQITTLKEQNQKLEYRIRILEEDSQEKSSCDEDIEMKMKNLQIDLEEIKQEKDSITKENATYKEQIESLEEIRLQLNKASFLLKECEKECDRYKNLYVDMCNSKDAISLELKEYKTVDYHKELHEQREKIANLERALQLAELKCSEFSKLLEREKETCKTELEKMRDTLSKEKLELLNEHKKSPAKCNKCIENISEKTKIEIELIRTANKCSEFSKDNKELEDQLTVAKELIDDLKDKSSEREIIIFELQQKAEQFEDYVRSQTSSDRSTTSRDQSVNTTPELDANNNQSFKKELEIRIRDEMAQIFAVELQKMDSQYKDVLESKENDLANLTGLMLKERKSIQDHIEKRKSDSAQLKQIVIKLKEELEQRQGVVVKLEKELKTRNDQIDAERESMKKVIQQCEAKNEHYDTREQHYVDRFNELKDDCEKQIEQWKVKFYSARNMSECYKKYSEEKEAFMKKEYERLKDKYGESIDKIEARVQLELNLRLDEYKALQIRCKCCGKVKDSQTKT
ncbi:CEP152 family protein [Megaselia abdita]